MADDEKNTDRRTDPEAPADGSEANSGRKRLLFIVGGATALLGLVLGGAGYVILRSNGEPSAEAVSPALPAAHAAAPHGTPPVPPPALANRDGIEFADELDVVLADGNVSAAHGEPKADGHGAEGSAPTVPNALGTIVSLEPFVVNISDGERDRFLKVKADLELADPGAATELQQRMPQIRDLVISLLGGKSFDEVRSIEGKNFLREELLLRINALLVNGKAKRVFFTEFVVQ